MDPQLLATLIIPFLETYMAVHSEMGFLLLEYPPEHLATVLAMQSLIGDDLLQVAGILDDTADGLGTSCCVTNGGSEEVQANAPKVPSFSKANFVLTSSATESEIATLIAAIWKILVDRSPFYIPDGAPGRMLEGFTTHDNPQQQQQHSVTYDSNQGMPFVHSPLINTNMQYTPLDSAAAMMGFQGLAAAAAATTAITPTPSYGTVYEEEKPPATATSLSTANASDCLLAESTTSATAKANNTRSSSSKTAMATTALRRQKKAKKLRSLLGRNPDADANADGDEKKGSPIRLPRLDTGSFLSINLSDDDDDDDYGNGEDDDRFAADERRYMPLFMRKNHDALKGNSRKALRFLGLSTET